MELVRIIEENGQTFAEFEKVVTEKKPISKEQLAQERENLKEENSKLEIESLKIQARMEDIEAKIDILSNYLGEEVEAVETTENGEENSQ